MKFVGTDKSPWTKRIWWLVLVILMTIFIALRRDALLGGTATVMDIFIFLIWISLLIVPLFREVNIFGVNLKKEIDSLKTETREQFSNLRSEIANTIQIYVGQPPPDEKLPLIKDTVSAQLPARPQTVSEQIQVPEFVQYASSIRYTIENELDRILSKLDLDVSTSTPLRGIHSMLLFLQMKGLITKEVYDGLETVLAICNRVILLGKFSEKQSQFVKDIAPSLIEKLRAINPP